MMNPIAHQILTGEDTTKQTRFDEICGCRRAIYTKMTEIPPNCGILICGKADSGTDLLERARPK